MASLKSTKGMQKILDRNLDLTAAGLKYLLVKSTYTPSSSHDFVDDVVAHECDATNYARAALASKTYTDGVLDAADPVFATLGGAANNELSGYWIFEDKGGADSANPLLCFIQFVANKTTNGTDFTITHHASGIMALV